MEDKDRRLDDELATLTDAIVEKRAMNPSDNVKEYESVVQGLSRLFSADEAPSAAFQERLTRRLTEEWVRTYRPQRRAAAPLLRYAVLAAALLIVVGVVLLLADDTAAPPVGTVVGSGEWLLPLGIVVGVVVIAYALWRGRR